MSKIEMTAIESSQLEAYGYDPKTETLAIRFKGKGKPGSLYHYRNFNETEWAAFSDAASKGSFFINRIKPHGSRYPYTRVDEGDTSPEAFVDAVKREAGQPFTGDPTDADAVKAWMDQGGNKE